MQQTREAATGSYAELSVTDRALLVDVLWFTEAGIQPIPCDALIPSKPTDAQWMPAMASVVSESVD